MKTSKLCIYLLCSVILSSCSKDFLDLKPISQTTPDNFYQTAEDMENALNGAYSALQFGGISTNSYVFGEVRSDNTVPVPSGSVTDQDEFDRFYIRSTNPYIQARWNDGYRGIARCNNILDRIGSIEWDENLKNKYIGETRFIRALIYFELVRTYGDIPLVLNEIQRPDEGYEFVRNPKSEIYFQIEMDLIEAEKILPISSSTNLGHATQGAAKALLGKVYLTQKKYIEASKKLKEVIDSDKYSILTDYASVFDADDGDNPEIIFAIQFMSGDLGEGNPWPNSFAPENSGNVVIPFGGSGNNQPSSDLINSYEPNDLRKDFSLATSYVNDAGQTIPYNFVRKYRDEPAKRDDNDNDIPVIRFADVVLMYAEALNEIGYEANGEAFHYINLIRNRAGLDDLEITEVSDQQKFRLAMEQERRVELAFEGHRWFDLVRTGRAIPVMNSKKDDFGLVKEVTEDQLIFPIPQSQIDINPDQIHQNPGY